ncbi:hypothetical protein PORY_001316 [Pneumocystis oryctolagi]|uniref:Uncharacterized protein n=1 Tax=Pneumocystis oryctolagi TaxID=42067 RepID=A0ACB7CBM7_9ASCO|nr:hypothetical protein PORY_001316 [Pneumocystis oryctolagi]
MSHITQKNEHKYVPKSEATAFFSLQRTRTIRGHNDIVKTLGWNCSGSRIASGSADHTLRIWNPDKLELRYSTELKGHTSSVDYLSWDPTHSDRLASVGKDKIIRIWDYREAKHITEIPTNGENITVSWSPDGKYIASGSKDDVITFVDVKEKKIINTIKQPMETNEISWSNSGDFFALATGHGTVNLIEWPSLKHVYTIDAHTSNCFCLEFDPKGRYLAVGGSDALVSLWDLEEFICVQTFSKLDWPVRTLGFSHDGQYIASASEENAIDISHVETGEHIYKISANAANKVCWHPYRFQSLKKKPFWTSNYHCHHISYVFQSLSSQHHTNIFLRHFATTVEVIDQNISTKKNPSIKKYRPVTPGRRWLRRPINDHLWKGRPIRFLTIAKRQHGGRNNHGRITVRHRGGGHKQRIRIVDFVRRTPGPHLVMRIEYDPGRSGHIALIKDLKTEKLSYILAANGLRAGNIVESYRTGFGFSEEQSLGKIDSGIFAVKAIQPGNCLPLSMIPVGTIIFALTTSKYGPAKFCRSAGTYAQLLSTGNEGYAVVKLKSGEIRKISVHAAATIGVASNIDWKHRKLGKAGRSRWLGIRPTVRGVAMNPRDHPHGGGRGKSKGNRQPCSPWGKLAKGKKTRTKRNPLVIKGRPR